MFPIESLPVLEHEPVREPVAVYPSQETGDHSSRGWSSRP
jgi:hypothetical protein